MHTIVKCPGCDRPLRIPTNSEGRIAQCPACNGTFTARSAPALPIVPLDALADRPLPPRPADATPLPAQPPLRTAWQGHSPLSKPAWQLSDSSSLSPRMIVGGIVAGAGVLGALIVFTLWPRGIPDSDWRSFTPPNKGFTVLMPGHVTTSSQQANGPMGRFTLTMYAVKRDGGATMFGVGYADLSPTEFARIPLSQRYAASRMGMMAAAPGSKLVSEKHVTISGQAGYMFEVDVPSHGTFVGWVCAANHRFFYRLYVVMAAGKGISPTCKDAQKFINSLKIHNR
jgi:hypothetical protein